MPPWFGQINPVADNATARGRQRDRRVEIAAGDIDYLLDGSGRHVGPQDPDLNPATTSFYIGRESLVMAVPSGMARWRAKLFIFMFPNAADATSFFRLPPDQIDDCSVPWPEETTHSVHYRRGDPYSIR